MVILPTHLSILPASDFSPPSLPMQMICSNRLCSMLRTMAEILNVRLCSTYLHFLKLTDYVCRNSGCCANSKRCCSESGHCFPRNTRHAAYFDRHTNCPRDVFQFRCKSDLWKPVEFSIVYPPIQNLGLLHSFTYHSVVMYPSPNNP